MVILSLITTKVLTDNLTFISNKKSCIYDEIIYSNTDYTHMTTQEVLPF